MSTQYYAPEQHGPDEQDPRRQDPTREQPASRQPMWQQPMWQQPGWRQAGWQQPGWRQPGWQQAPGQYTARRSTPWGVIMAVGAAIIVGCTLALVFLFGHSGSTAPGGGTPASTSGSDHHAVSPAVPTHPAG